MNKKALLTVVIMVLLIAAAAVVWLQSDDSASNEVLNDFSIEDTTNIVRITMSDASGRVVDLKREGPGQIWMADECKAQQESAALLLKTFKRLKVKSTVPKAAHNTVVTQIISQHCKVDVYVAGEDKPVKIYYVGNPTQDHYGTYMLLEDPDDGISAEPFIVDMPGFNGFLSTRFHADIYQWCHSAMFEYNLEQIKSLTVAYHDEPENSFRIEQNGTEVELSNPATNTQYANFDTLRVYNYLSFYNKVHYEKYERRFDAINTDSIRNAMPMYTISLTTTGGVEHKLDIFRKQYEGADVDAEGNPIEYDLERMYAVFDDGELLTVQNFHMDRLFVPVSVFGVAPPIP